MFVLATKMNQETFPVLSGTIQKQKLHSSLQSSVGIQLIISVSFMEGRRNACHLLENIIQRLIIRG